MTASRWAEIRRLYDAALELPAADREPYVRENACDPELLQEVTAMLGICSEDGGLLDISLIGRQWVRPAVVARMLVHGQTLAGRYLIVRPIGAGGMGEVYEAEDLELGAAVAIKTMRVEYSNALANFKREIQLARTITHPNVCRIFDLHRHHDAESGGVVTFLTMELVDGESLTVHLRRRGALTPAETLPIALQIGAALVAAHEKGVIHRDLKSGNVMLAADGQRAVVTDFGLAHTLTQSTESSVTIAGTPAYMAPEQFEGKPPTPAVDIYAFGVLLYEMVVGQRPFNGDSPIALALDKIRKKPPRAGDTIPALPAIWSDVIRRCMDPDPRRRLTDLRDALKDLHESVDHPPLIRLSRLQKRIVGSVVLLLVCLGLGGWLYTRSVYSPSGEAVRLYRLGAHAQQLGLPWAATRLFERALVKDERFIAARASLAEAWMDLDQPKRALAELQRAADLRPQWRRVAECETLLEQAAWAQLRGAMKESAILHRTATTAAPEADKTDVAMSEARSDVRADDPAAAIERYASLETASQARCPALMAHAVLTAPAQLFLSRRLSDKAKACFEEAGDLDAIAQEMIERVRVVFASVDSRQVDGMLRRALSIAEHTGNLEQQIQVGALFSRLMLENGDDESAYTFFSRSLQVADQNGLEFVSGRILQDRAQYFFDQGDFLQADAVNSLSQYRIDAADAPHLDIKRRILQIRLLLRMGLLQQVRDLIGNARSSLNQFPNDKLSAQLTELENLAKKTPGRPE